MVSLSKIRHSNSLISTNFPSRLVAVFVGATSGIGAITLKTFTNYTLQPRIYIIGRSQESADRIISDCRTLNSSGEYIFIKSDVSLIKNVDRVCQQIKGREEAINLLFLSQGAAVFDRSGNSPLL
jgi:NADP-dependent 3-hydroxy acid dehydrogenase YdfG